MHKIILEKVKTLPNLYQQMFEQWRFSMGIEGAYRRVMENLGMDRQMGVAA